VVEMLADAAIQAVIPASDLDRAKAFYRDTLGLTLVRERTEEITFESGGKLFDVYRTPSAGQAAHTLASFKVSDLDAEMKELRSRGIAFEDYDFPGLKTVDGVAEGDGLRAAWFKDSEGNILCVAQGD
jgi:catechol 2,3-dioxygenase-like lactoylglutathione lyase family enzyme